MNDFEESWWVIESWAGEAPGSVKIDGYVHSIHATKEEAEAVTDRYVDIIRCVKRDSVTGKVHFE